MIHSNILLHKVCGEEIFMITWISCTFASGSVTTIKYGEKSGNDFVNSIIFRTFEDRNN